MVGSGIPEDRAKEYEVGVKEGGIVMGFNPRSDEDATHFEQEWNTNKGEHVYRGQTTIPVVEEELQVGKREVERGGVRVESRVEEKPVAAEVQLREEHVRVERRPVDRPVTDADKAFREGSLEVTERAEEAVVSKTARVVEEVVVGKQVEEHTETVSETLRRTDVDVQEVNQGRDPQGSRSVRVCCVSARRKPSGSRALARRLATPPLPDERASSRITNKVDGTRGGQRKMSE